MIISMPSLVGTLLLLLLVNSFGLVKLGQDDGTDTELKVLQLVAMVSEGSSEARKTQISERGLEILPGARVAVQEVNRNTDILPGYQLELVEIITEGCNDNIGLVKLIQHLTTNTEKEGGKETVGIVGPPCTSGAVDILAAVAGHPGISLVQIAAMQFAIFADKRSRHSYLFQMVPIIPAFINAVIMLMEEFGRREMVVLCSTQFTCTVANTLITQSQRDSNLKIADFVAVWSRRGKSNIQQTLALVRESGAKIVVAVLTPGVASELLCAALLEDMSWPEYGWILPDTSIENCSCDCDGMGLATEGLILFNVTGSVSVGGGTQLVSGHTYSTFNSYYVQELNETAKRTQRGLQSNFYASVFYDSVWAFALALSQLSQLEIPHQKNVTAARITFALLNLSNFSGATGTVAFDREHNRKHLVIQISQERNGQFIAVGQYDHTFKIISINSSFLQELPSSNLEVVYEKIPVGLTVVFSIVTGLNIFFLTALLFLHLYYHSEPEVKATKLARFMFVGCYLIHFGALTIIIIHSVEIHGTFWRIATCQLFLWLTNLGPFALLAALLIRMLRVHRVFSHFGPMGRVYTTGSLALVILCLVLVMVLIMTVWAAVDVHQITNYSEIRRPDNERPYMEVTQYCNSDYYEIWIVMVVLCHGSLLLGILILAVKMRKVRSANFKDTKKVNLLVLILIMIWTLFPSVRVTLAHKDDFALNSVLTIVPIQITALSYQFLLFLPKLWAPLFRSLNGRLCNPN